MSKSSIATTQKIPSQLPTKSAWAKGPPPNTSSTAGTPRSQSPASGNATPPTSATHSRRPSGLSQGFPLKDGVSVPRNTVGAVKQSSAVTFGSIDDVSSSISPSPAVAPAVKSDGVKAPGHVNGKPSISSGSKNPPPPNGTAVPATSATPAPSKPIMKVDVRKLFQGSPSSGPAQTPPSDTASPSTRPMNLPAQQQQHPSQQQQQPGQQSHPQLAPHNYTTFVPSRALPSQQQNSGPGRGPPGSPVFTRQPLPNGAGGRPPGGPNGPGPQMPNVMSSPRMGSHPGQQQPGMPPPSQMPIPGWPGHYYSQDPYIQPYYSGWYMPGSPMPHQQLPQHHPHQGHPHNPSGPPGQHTGMPMSPRTQPPPLQGPSTPTLSHTVPSTIHTSPHQPPTSHLHSHTNSVSNNLTSPPPTPSTSSHGNLPSSGAASARLNTNASTFVPMRASKIVIKSQDGTEVDLTALKKGSPVPQPGSPGLGSFNTGNNGSAAANRRSIRMESEDAKKKRIAEEEAKKEKERAKKEAEAKAKKDAEEKAKREEEERIAVAKRKEEEEKERVRREEEERIRKEEEEKERLRKQAEERERLQKEGEERMKKEEAERIRKAEEAKAAEEAERIKREEEAKAAAEAALKDQEDGEVVEKQEEPAKDPVDIQDHRRDKLKDKENLRIDTSTASPSVPDLPRKRPGPLDLSYNAKTIPASLPSALATARIIDDIGQITYPEGIRSPKVELNINAKDGKFKYDREFLLQFMSICKEKPDMLPPLEAIGLEPTDQNHSMSRGGSGRRSASAMAPSNPRQASVGLGIGSFGKAGASNPFSMGNFATPAGGKLSSEERFAMSSGRAVSVGGPAGLPFGRPSPLVRTPSQGGPSVHPMGSNRVRSKRGEKRNDGNKVSGHQQSHGSGFNQGLQGQMGPGGIPLEPVAPLELSANRWTAGSTSRKSQPMDPDSPELVDRKVKGLLNKLTMEKFDSISDQIIAWANKSETEKDGRTLIQVIRLVFEKATDEAAWSEMYARLCRKMMEQISPKVQDDGIKNPEGKPIAGGQLFRKYLLNRCQEDFERGWAAKDAAAAAAVAKASEDEAVKQANDKNKDGEDEPVLYSEEYYAAQKAKRQGLGLIKFIGELFKLQMLTERIMHECVKKLLGNVENPEEEEIESLCKLLTTVGQILDTNKARAHMDVYFSRMKELTRSGNVSSRMQYMLQDVIELRERRWVSRNQVAAPATIAQIHEGAAKDRAAAEKESFQRQISMSRGGSRRGGERGQFDQQAGPDGWAVAGGSAGPPRPPPKAGDLSNFGKINKSQPMTFGPSSVFAGKKESKGGRAESLSRTASSSNMFSMLSQNPELAAAEAASKASRPPSRKTSVDLGQSGVPEPPAQRRKLNLLPRSKPTEHESTPASPDVSEEGEVVEDGIMSEADAKKRIDEDSKEFFAVRNLEEAEVYFTNLTDEHHFRLVDKLVTKAIESKETDAQLVGDFFDHAVSKELCSQTSFEEGFSVIAQILDDIAIDAPKAFDLMAIMMKGADLDRERQTRIAAKTDSDKLLALLS